MNQTKNKPKKKKKTSKATYKRILVNFFSFLHGKTYPLETEFTQAQFLSVTPEELVRYFSLRAYGNEYPDEESRPEKARTNTISFDKKALSHFWPNKKLPYDEVNKKGNPTKSSLISEFIKQMQKHEVRREGAPSRARREIEYYEFLAILKCLRMNAGGKWKNFRASALLCLQWHLISRVDDMCKLKRKDIYYNHAFPFTLLCKMRWSKNILDERDSPEQLILALWTRGSVHW